MWKKKIKGKTTGHQENTKNTTKTADRRATCIDYRKAGEKNKNKQVEGLRRNASYPSNQSIHPR